MEKIFFRVKQITDWHFNGKPKDDSSKHSDYLLEIEVDWFFPPQSIEIKSIKLQGVLEIKIGDQSLKRNFKPEKFASKFLWLEKGEDFKFKGNELNCFKNLFGSLSGPLFKIQKVDFDIPLSEKVFKPVKVEPDGNNKTLLVEIEEKEIFDGFKLKYLRLVSQKDDFWIDGKEQEHSVGKRISEVISTKGKIELKKWNDIEENIEMKGEHFLWNIEGLNEKDILNPDIPDKPDDSEDQNNPPPPPRNPLPPSPSEILAAKNRGNAAVNSGEKDQLIASKTELEQLKKKLEEAGASDAEIDNLIKTVQTKLQVVLGDDSYRQTVLSEITVILNENGLTENDLGVPCREKLRQLRDKKTSGADINQDGNAIKSQIDNVIVEKKVIGFTSQVDRVIKNGKKQDKENLKNKIISLSNNSKYKGKKVQLQALIQKLENSLKDQSLPKINTSNHNSSSFPWGYFLPIASIIVLVIGTIIWKRKKQKIVK